MAYKLLAVAMVLLSTALAAAQNAVPAASRPRAADLGLKIGVLPAGPLDAITDVAGVEVGQTTIIRGDNIRTGVTAVLPHSGNLYREKVPGAVFVGNGFGKLAGSTQINEMGDIERPSCSLPLPACLASRTRSSVTCWRCPATKTCCPSTRWSAKPTMDT